MAVSEAVAPRVESEPEKKQQWWQKKIADLESEVAELRGNTVQAPPSVPLQPLSWKVHPTEDNPEGVPGVVLYGYDAKPGHLTYIEETSATELSAWSLDWVASVSKSTITRAVDPKDPTNNDRLGGFFMKNCGPFSPKAKIRITWELINEAAQD